MGLHPTRAIADSAFVGVPLGPKPPGLVGTAGTSISAIELGDGMTRRTILKVTTPISLVTSPDDESLCDGHLIYTFPAGQIIIHEVYGDIGLEIDDATNVADTPEVGLGTVIGTGAIATLGASDPLMEDIWGPHVVTGCDVGAAPTDAIQQVTNPAKILLGAGVHLVHFNVADVWTNGNGTADLFLQAGRFIIDWTLIPAEGL